MKPQIIICIHGIRTGQVSSAWQERFKQFIFLRYIKGNADAPRIDTLQKEYYAGAFPAFNVFVKNPFLADSLADEIIPYIRDGAEISFLMHSNGADVGLRTMKILAADGYKIKSAVFIAGAIEPDVQKNGIAKLVTDGSLGSATAYCSSSDEILGLKWIIWPYGRLGHEGFKFGALGMLPAKIHDWWFPHFGHCSYFSTGNEQKTFELALKDLGITE